MIFAKLLSIPNLKRSAKTRFKYKIISTNFLSENYKDLKVRSDADLVTIEYAMEGNAIKSTDVEVIEQN